LIFDYTLLTSFLFTSLLILILGYTNYLIKEWIQKNDSAGKAENQYNSKKVDINCRLVIFLIVAIIISRTGFVVTFPVAVQKYGRADFLFSMRTIFLIWQSIVILTYIYFLFRIFLEKRLKDDYHYQYLQKTFLFYAVFSILDLISSFLLYNFISYDLIFPVSKNISPTILTNTNSESFYGLFLLLIMLTGFVLFFIRIQKKRAPFNFISYSILHLFTLMIIIYFMYENIAYYFAGQSLLHSALNIFSVSSGFAGLIWLVILYLGIASQTFAYTIIRWKDKFINKQIAINYTVQLSRLSFVSVICLSFIAVLPMIFILVIKSFG
jgi:hypothetical protein